MTPVTEAERERIAKKAYELAYEYDQKYGSCPQCVLAAISDVFGGVDGQVIQASHALAGGTALTGDGTCGALSGGILALGTIYGRKREHFKRRQMKSFTLAKKLADRFAEEFGGINCNDVQKTFFGRCYDLWNPEEYKEFDACGAHDDKCPNVAGKVAQWVAEILLEEGVEPEKVG